MDSEQIKIYLSRSITYAAAVLFSVARFASRIVGKRGLWLDDYLIIPALIGATYRLIVFCTALRLGLGLPDDEVTRILHERNQPPYALAYLTYINNFGWTITLGFAKLSICALYWRLFQHSSIRNGIRIAAGLTALWMVAATFSMAIQCIPIESAWNEAVPGTCANTLAQRTWPVACHLAIDIFILALPTIQVYRLDLPLLQRLCLVLIFMFGIAICALAIIILSLTLEWADTNCYSSASKCLSYYLRIYRVSAAEPSLVVISASMPVLAPLYYRCYGSRHGQTVPPRSGKDPLDRTQPRRNLDTFDEQHASHAIKSGSSHGLAQAEEVSSLEDRSARGDNLSIESEPKEHATAAEVRPVGV